MKWIDRAIWGLLLATVAAVVLPVAVSPITTLAVVLTCCYVAVQVVRYLTDRW